MTYTGHILSGRIGDQLIGVMVIRDNEDHDVDEAELQREFLLQVASIRTT